MRNFAEKVQGGLIYVRDDAERLGLRVEMGDGHGHKAGGFGID